MSHVTALLSLYFAYGSNLDPSQMRRRCPGAEAFGIAVLDGWQFRIGERGVATIVPAQGTRTWGGLWTVTKDHLRSLDRAEGVDAGRYRRDTLTVQCDGADITAIVYIEDFVGQGEPRPGYLERILRGARWFGLPEEYQATLAEVTV